MLYLKQKKNINLKSQLPTDRMGIVKKKESCSLLLRNN